MFVAFMMWPREVYIRPLATTSTYNKYSKKEEPIVPCITCQVIVGIIDQNISSKLHHCMLARIRCIFYYVLMLRIAHEKHNPQMAADTQKPDEQTYAVIGAATADGAEPFALGFASSPQPTA
jgi:hypothetical protein